MTENESKKERLRRERREAEARERSAEQRAKILKLIGAIGVAAVLIVAVLIVVSQSGGDERGVETTELLAGIEQQGSVLGDPSAGYTLVEFADLQCPHCRDFSRDVMPEIIEGPVRDGELRVDFRNWAVLGQGSVLAAAAALSAGDQGLYWEFVDTLFEDPNFQVNIDNLRQVAEDAGVPDLEAWEAGIEDERWGQELTRADRQARNLGFEGTPAFAIETPDGELVAIDNPGSAEDVRAAIAGAS